MTADLLDGPDSAATTGSGPGLLTVLWRRKAYLIFGAVVGLVMGYLDYLRREPAYQSTAQLYVQKRRSDPLPAAPGGALGSSSQLTFIEDFLATHETLIRSAEVLALAARYLEKIPLESPPLGGNYVGYIASGLTISRDKTSTGKSANILNIAFNGPSSKDCETVIQAVIEGYRDSLKGGVAEVTEREREQVRLALIQIDSDVDKLDEAYKVGHGKILEISTTTVMDLKSRVNLNEGKLRELVLREIDLKYRLKLVNDAKATGKDRRGLLAVLQGSSISKDGRPTETKEARRADDPLVALRLQEEELLLSLGKDHPQIIALRRRIKALEDQTVTGGSVDDGVDFFVQVIGHELDAIKLQTTFLDEELKQDRGLVQTLEGLQGDEVRLTEKREVLRKRRADLEDRQKQMALTKDTQLFDARAINPPGPGRKVSPVLLQCLMLALVLGLAGGGGLAYLAEMTDKSFRSPDDVRRRLGLAVVGHVPALDPAKLTQAPAGTIDNSVVVHHRPKSTEAEAYRGVRTALYFSSGGRNHQVIQVTSPNPGDGKSTLCANLAVTIAQSGKRVVLVDCDFRKPRVHKIFGVSPELGLASVITGEIDLAHATQPSGVAGLSLLPCGPRPANPAELLTSTRFQEVLAEIKSSFDYVLIDTPPMLAVSDPAVVAPRVDGVILTIRITRKTRPAAQRAKEILGSVGANVVGVVVNDLPAGKNSGLYGYGYGYGQYSSDGYGYAEHYGDAIDESQVSIIPEALPIAEPISPPAHSLS